MAERGRNSLGKQPRTRTCVCGRYRKQGAAQRGERTATGARARCRCSRARDVGRFRELGGEVRERHELARLRCERRELGRPLHGPAPEHVPNGKNEIRQNGEEKTDSPAPRMIAVEAALEAEEDEVPQPALSHGPSRSRARSSSRSPASPPRLWQESQAEARPATAAVASCTPSQVRPPWRPLRHPPARSLCS